MPWVYQGVEAISPEGGWTRASSRARMLCHPSLSRQTAGAALHAGRQVRGWRVDVGRTVTLAGDGDVQVNGSARVVDSSREAFHRIGTDSSQATSSLTQQIAASAQELADTAEGLRALIGRFTVA
jgi:hypothetical protein